MAEDELIKRMAARYNRVHALASLDEHMAALADEVRQYDAEQAAELHDGRTGEPITRQQADRLRHEFLADRDGGLNPT